MSSISIRKENPATRTEEPRSIAQSAPWESRLMRNLFGWDPFREMAPFVTPFPASLEFAPAFDVKETKDAYVFRADVPGVLEKDLEITMTGNRLTVHGKREQEHKEQSDTLYTYERSYGSFSRSFTLPEGADANRTSADLKDGVLTISLAKKPEAQAKQIQIKSPAQKS